MAAGMAVSILLFSNQTEFVGFVARHHAKSSYGIGDLTFEVGFLVAALIYFVGYRLENRNRVAVPT